LRNFKIAQQLAHFYTLKAQYLREFCIDRLQISISERVILRCF